MADTSFSLLGVAFGNGVQVFGLKVHVLTSQSQILDDGPSAIGQIGMVMGALVEPFDDWTKA